MKYQEILNKGYEILRNKNIKSPSLDSELILSKVIKKTREEILINLNDEISNKQKNKFVFYLNKRKKKIQFLISWVLHFFGNIDFL